MRTYMSRMVFRRVNWTFFRRTDPATTIANPACIKNMMIEANRRKIKFVPSATLSTWVRMSANSVSILPATQFKDSPPSEPRPQASNMLSVDVMVSLLIQVNFFTRTCNGYNIYPPPLLYDGQQQRLLSWRKIYVWLCSGRCLLLCCWFLVDFLLLLLLVWLWGRLVDGALLLKLRTGSTSTTENVNRISERGLCSFQE